jgi:hypothetical protein
MLFFTVLYVEIAGEARRKCGRQESSGGGGEGGEEAE